MKLLLMSHEPSIIRLLSVTSQPWRMYSMKHNKPMFSQSQELASRLLIWPPRLFTLTTLLKRHWMLLRQVKVEYSTHTSRLLLLMIRRLRTSECEWLMACLHSTSISPQPLWSQNFYPFHHLLAAQVELSSLLLALASVNKTQPMWCL